MKALHGLKQALKQWCNKFSTKLLQFGFVQSEHDHRLFFLRSDNMFLTLNVYVDDILFIEKHNGKIDEVK